MPAQPQLLIAMAVYTALLLLIFRLPVFAFLDKAEKGRDAHLDGLRFFLAIAVVYHHSTVAYNYFDGRGWTFDVESYPVIWRFGRYAVAAFFMLSAYLFAHKKYRCLTDLTRFYTKRVLRIAPMVLLTCAITTTLLVKTHVTASWATWQDFLLSPFWPYHGSSSAIKPITASVMWTLPFEWLLYLAIPFNSIAKNNIAPVCMDLGIAFLMIFAIQRGWMDGNFRFLICFPLGMLARDLKGKFNLPSVQKALLITFFIAMLFLLKTDPASPLNLCLLFVPFYLIVDGSNFFGLLNARGAVRLGEASFSIYLLHGTFFFLFYWFTRPLSFSPSVNLACLFILICMICGLSTLTYRFIELPFMRPPHRRQPRLRLQRRS